jgi:hypothetical protein
MECARSLLQGASGSYHYKIALRTGPSMVSLSTALNQAQDASLVSQDILSPSTIHIACTSMITSYLAIYISISCLIER